MVSVSVTVLEKVSGGLMSCDHEEVAGIREREGDMVRNQAEVVMSIVDGTREWTLSRRERSLHRRRIGGKIRGLLAPQRRQRVWTGVF